MASIWLFLSSLFLSVVFGNELLNIPPENTIDCDETVTGSIVSNEIVFYEFVVENNIESITFSTCNSDYDTFLYVKRLDEDDNIVDVTSCDDCGNCGFQTLLTVTRKADFGDINGIYYVGVGGFLSSSGNYELEMTCEIIEPSEEVIELLSIPDDKSNTLGCDSSIHSQLITGRIVSEEIDYYRFIIPDNIYSMTLESCDSNYDTFLSINSIYRNSVLLDELSCDDCGDCGTRAILDITQEDEFDAGVYFAGIGGFENSAGNYVVRLHCAVYDTIPFMDELANLLCDVDLWSIIKGTWSFFDFNGEDCIVENSNSGQGNIVWIGSSDGNTPNDEFTGDENDNSFIFQVYLQIASGNNAGVIFRANSVSGSNNVGAYYFAINPLRNRIQLGEFINGIYNPIDSYILYEIEYDREYILTVEAIGDKLYNFYVDDLLVFSNYQLNRYIDGSIGLRSYFSLPKYTRVAYCQGNGCVTSAPTAVPTEQPTVGEE